jgi:elongation factor P
MAVELDGQVWLVIATVHVKPGKGPAYTQAKLRNLKTGTHIEKRLRTGEDISAAALERRELEYLYSDASGAVFMDNKTYDQTVIEPAMLGDALLYVKPNTMVTVLVHEGRVVTLDLPPVVDLAIVETPPGIKDATKTNQLKEATCETGLKTRVPAFIAQGEVVRISTQTGEYMGRA